MELVPDLFTGNVLFIINGFFSCFYCPYAIHCCCVNGCSALSQYSAFPLRIFKYMSMHSAECNEILQTAPGGLVNSSTVVELLSNTVERHVGKHLLEFMG